MDPTANLQEQRAIANRILMSGHCEPWEAERLATLVDALMEG